MTGANLIIPRNTVIEICDEIYSKHKRSRLWPLGLGKLQCWGCRRFGKVDDNYDNICALNHEENRGCWQINRIYDRDKVESF